MIHTKAFFAHIVQSRGPIAMGKSNGVKGERVPMSPAEQNSRIRRAARALQQGAMQQDLIARGFKAAEIKQAVQMIGKK